MNVTATMLRDVDTTSPVVAQSTLSSWGRDLYDALPERRVVLAEARIGQVLSYVFMSLGVLQHQVHRFCIIGRLNIINTGEPVLVFEVFTVNGGERLLAIEVLLRNGIMLLDGEAVGWAQTYEDVQLLIERAFRSKTSRCR